MPVVAAGFLIGAFALSGIPPLNGFVSEYMILQAGLQKGGYYPFLSVVLLVLTFVMFAAYIRVFQRVFLTVGEERKEVEVSYLSIYIIAPIVILSILCILLGVFPAPVVDAINKLLLAIVGG